jgi:hypothetical protein
MRSCQCQWSVRSHYGGQQGVRDLVARKWPRGKGEKRIKTSRHRFSRGHEVMEAARCSRVIDETRNGYFRTLEVDEQGPSDPASCAFAERMHILLMNMRLGYALLRDRRVPIRIKLIALGIGAASVGAIELLQLPIEGVVAALLPFLGAAGDLALDGAEAVIGPLLIATLILPHLAPAQIVEQVRAETERTAYS